MGREMIVKIGDIVFIVFIFVILSFIGIWLTFIRTRHIDNTSHQENKTD
jgi:hypothetical protein